MADRVSAHIMIGGTIARHHYPALVQAIVADNPAVDWALAQTAETRSA